MRCVLLFESVYHVMRAEKLLKGNGVEVDLIPVPREISSDCGVAVEIAWEERKEVSVLLESKGISVLETYRRNPQGRFEKEFHIEPR